MRHVLLAAAALYATVATCSQRAREPMSPLPHSAAKAPAHALTHAMVSNEMSPACADAAERALEHLNALGAELEVIGVEEDHPSLALEPRTGEIAIHAGIPKSHPRLAETFTWRAPNGRTVLRAEVVLGLCSASLVAHEVGHALGIASQVDHELLLHPSDGAPWDFDPLER